MLSLESGIWNLEEKQQVFPLLLLTLPAHWWGVTLAWLPDGGVFGWKIDAQEPLRRTGTGFETMDLILDAIVEPDLSGWTMKDTAELEAASELGILSPEEVRQVRSGMDDALRRLRARSSPFDPSWAAWKPDGHGSAG